MPITLVGGARAQARVLCTGLSCCSAATCSPFAAYFEHWQLHPELPYPGPSLDWTLAVVHNNPRPEGGSEEAEEQEEAWQSSDGNGSLDPATGGDAEGSGPTQSQRPAQRSSTHGSLGSVRARKSHTPSPFLCPLPFSESLPLPLPPERTTHQQLRTSQVNGAAPKMAGQASTINSMPG